MFWILSTLLDTLQYCKMSLRSHCDSWSLFIQYGMILITVCGLNSFPLLCLSSLVKYDLNDIRKQQKLNTMNNVATVLVFFTVLINIFITALGFESGRWAMSPSGFYLHGAWGCNACLRQDQSVPTRVLFIFESLFFFCAADSVWSFFLFVIFQHYFSLFNIENVYAIIYIAWHCIDNDMSSCMNIHTSFWVLLVWMSRFPKISSYQEVTSGSPMFFSRDSMMGLANVPVPEMLGSKNNTGVWHRRFTTLSHSTSP